MSKTTMTFLSGLVLLAAGIFLLVSNTVADVTEIAVGLLVGGAALLGVSAPQPGKKGESE